MKKNLIISILAFLMIIGCQSKSEQRTLKLNSRISVHGEVSASEPNFIKISLLEIQDTTNSSSFKYPVGGNHVSVYFNQGRIKYDILDINYDAIDDIILYRQAGSRDNSGRAVWLSNSDGTFRYDSIFQNARIKRVPHLKTLIVEEYEKSYGIKTFYKGENSQLVRTKRTKENDGITYVYEPNGNDWKWTEEWRKSRISEYVSTEAHFKVERGSKILTDSIKILSGVRHGDPLIISKRGIIKRGDFISQIRFLFSDHPDDRRLEFQQVIKTDSSWLQYEESCWDSLPGIQILPFPADFKFVTYKNKPFGSHGFDNRTFENFPKIFFMHDGIFKIEQIEYENYNEKFILTLINAEGTTRKIQLEKRDDTWYARSTSDEQDWGNLTNELRSKYFMDINKASLLTMHTDTCNFEYYYDYAEEEYYEDATDL